MRKLHQIVLEKGFIGGIVAFVPALEMKPSESATMRASLKGKRNSFFPPGDWPVITNYHSSVPSFYRIVQSNSNKPPGTDGQGHAPVDRLEIVRAREKLSALHTRRPLQGK